MTMHTGSKASWPSDFILFVLIVLSFSTSSVVFIEPAPTDIFMLGTAVLWFAHSRNLVRLPIPIYILLAVLVLTGFLPLAIPMSSGDFFATARYLTITIYLIIGFLAISTLAKSGGEDFFILVGNTLLVAALITLIPSLLTLLGLWSIPGVLFTGIRIKGFFKDPNVFGPFMVLAFSFAYYRTLYSKMLARFLYLALTLFFAIGAILSFSRAAWLGILIILALMIIFRLASLRVQLTLLAYIVFILSIISIPLLQHPQITELLQDRSRLQIYDQDRFGTQAEVLSLAGTNPIGFGAGQADHLLPQATHNSYVRVLFENGWLGLAAYCILVLATTIQLICQMRKNRHGRPIYVLLMGILVSLCINGLVIDTVHWRHFWLVLALCWGNYKSAI